MRTRIISFGTRKNRGPCAYPALAPPSANSTTPSVPPTHPSLTVHVHPDPTMARLASALCVLLAAVVAVSAAAVTESEAEEPTYVHLHCARCASARAANDPPPCALHCVPLLPAQQPPRARRVPGAETALLVRARRDGVRGAADGGAGSAPRLAELCRPRGRARREAAAAHHADAVIPAPLRVVGAAPGVRRRHGRRDRRPRHRRVPHRPRVLRRGPVTAAAAQHVPRPLRLDDGVQRLRVLQQQARRRQDLPPGVRGRARRGG